MDAYLRRAGQRGFCVCVLLLATQAVYPAAPAQIPDSLKPGGLRDRGFADEPPPRESGSSVFVPPRAVQDARGGDGLRIDVRRFAVEGARERREYGVWMEDLERLLSDAVSRQSEGFDLAGLNAVAASVQEFYRDCDSPYRQGSRCEPLLVANAFVPVQDVKDGVVTIRVVEGIVSNVEIEYAENAKANVYREKQLAQAVDRLVGEPLSADTAESVFYLLQRDYPGLRGSARLLPSTRVGETSVAYTVREARRFDARIGFDSYGLEETGKTRGIASLGFNNLLGLADRLELVGLRTFDPANAWYYGASYRARISPVVALHVGANRFPYEFDLPQSGNDVEIESEASQYFANIELTLERSRVSQATLNLGLEYKESLTDIEGLRTTEDRVTVLAGGFDWFKANERGVWSVAATIRRGLPGVFDALDSRQEEVTQETTRPGRLSRNGEFATGEFATYQLGVERTVFLPRLFGGGTRNDARLLLRGQGFYSSDLLVALERFSIGGPQSVRSYNTSAFLADRGLFGSIEYQFPINRELEFGVFFDAAWGNLLDADEGTPGDGRAVDGAGLALYWRGRKLNFAVQAAKTVSGTEFDDDNGERVWATLSLSL